MTPLLYASAQGHRNLFLTKRYVFILISDNAAKKGLLIALQVKTGYTE